MIRCRYRPSPDAEWLEFTLNADDPFVALDKIQRRMHPGRTEAEWRALEDATDRRLQQIRLARQEREQRERELGNDD